MLSSLCHLLDQGPYCQPWSWCGKKIIQPVPGSLERCPVAVGALELVPCRLLDHRPYCQPWSWCGKKIIQPVPGSLERCPVAPWSILVLCAGARFPWVPWSWCGKKIVQPVPGSLERCPDFSMDALELMPCRLLDQGPYCQPWS